MRKPPDGKRRKSDAVAIIPTATDNDPSSRGARAWRGPPRMYGHTSRLLPTCAFKLPISGIPEIGGRRPSRLAEPVIGPAEGRTRWLAPQGDGQGELFLNAAGMTVTIGSNVLSVAGKVAIVTGAGAGIGRAIALAFAQAGAAVGCV